MMRLTMALWAAVLMLAGCYSTTDPGRETSASPTPTPVRRPPEKIDRELEQAIAEIAKDADGRVGVGVVMLETGDSAYLDRHGKFVMQSVYKLPIAMTVAKLIDDNKLRIDAELLIRPDDFVRRGYHSPIRNLHPEGTVMPLVEVVRYSLAESDGTANDVLLDLAGGPANVQQYLSSIGLADVVVADSTKAISRDWQTQYRNWATPDGSVKMMTALLDRRAGLSEVTTGILLKAMTDSETGRRRIRRGLPEGATLAHKTGTGGRPSEIPGYRPPDGNSNSNSAKTRGAETTNKAIVKHKEDRDRRTRATPTPTRPEIGGEIGDDEQHEVTSATNDVGIITLPDGRHIVLAIYIQDSTADGPTREKVIADIAKAVCDRWMTGQLPEIGKGE